MRLLPALLVPILTVGVLANYRVDGTKYESDLIAAPLVPGQRVANDVYKNCQEMNEKGELVSEGETCFSNGSQYMIQALADAHNALQAVALLSNTISGVQSIAVDTKNSTASTSGDSPATSSRFSLDTSPIESVSSKVKRQDEDFRRALLDELHGRIRGRDEDGHRPDAVQVVHSRLHPMDGLAIRANVYSGDATLHVHTNGSHATAAFESDPHPTLGRRDVASTSGSKYCFQEAQGLKLQIGVAEKQDYGVFSALLSELAHGKDRMAPKLKESDSWGFVLCRQSDNLKTLRAKLVTEDDGAAY